MMVMVMTFIYDDDNDDGGDDNLIMIYNKLNKKQ